MKSLLSTIVLVISTIALTAQPASDRTLAGLRGNVKSVQTWSQDTDRNGKPAYPVRKESTDEYDKAGNLVKSTYHSTGGRSLYFLLDGQRVSKYEQSGKAPVVHTIVAPAGSVEQPSPAKPKGDARYEHKYTYKYDKAGRITEIQDHRNDGSLWQTRKFTYDEAGRPASELVTENGQPSFGDLFKYDANGILIERASIFYLANGEKEITPFRYSKIKLDSSGNWIERTVTQGDGNDAEVIAVETRKIKYY